jgi:exopolyphosphatase/guanosine-5'-triphosphate,3'-diphosphate pyrophosphatase
LVKAVIDLGTNTFHLLIAETDLVSRVKPIHQKRAYVFLASEGLDKITKDAVQRATQAARDFKLIIDKAGVEQVLVSGTEALRKASNGRELASKLEAILECPIHIISGEIEAQLIGRGVEAALGNLQINALAIDIGGGSTEMVYLESGKTKSYISATCRIAYLYNKFHRQDPITITAVKSIESYIRDSYQGFINSILERDKPVNLIGVAGSFEVLLHTTHDSDMKISGTHLTPFNLKVVDQLLDELLPLNPAQRETHTMIPPERSLYIIEALLIIRTLTRMIEFDTFYISEYSIKHGLMLSDF